MRKQSTDIDWEGLVFLWNDVLWLEGKKREEVPSEEEVGRGGRALGTCRLKEHLIFLYNSHFASLSLHFHQN